ncbi:thioredoxin domain-containing protein 5 [Dermatophagoides farinae]|uniref:thioredoxin domain-containing protein 5 n=1 Tax=Dermatophagoides farinae TaxID=6954 RepID=UPI003F5E0503
MKMYRKNFHLTTCSIIFAIIQFIIIIHRAKSKELSMNEFDDWDKSQKYLFVLFYSSESCKRCAQTLLDWKLFENRFGNVHLFSEVQIGHVDCNVHRDLCSREDIQELPMAKLYVELNKITRIEINYESNEYDRNSLDMFLLKQITRFGFQQQDSQRQQQQQQSDISSDESTDETGGFTVMQLKAKNGLYELTDDDSALFLSQGQHFVNFYAPWCSHCQHLKPKWEMIAKSLENNEQVKISQINCQENIYACKMQYKIKEYPTLLWISNGKIVARYKGSHEIDHIKSFINSQLTDFELDKLLKKYSDADSGIEELEIDYRKKTSNVILLNADNFKGTTDSGWTFVHFTVPWSRHCRQMKSEWDKFSINVPNSLKVAKVDCSIQEKLCTLEKIDSYPTLMLYHDGHKLPEYDDKLRTADSFLQYFNIQSNNLPKTEL